MADSRVGSGPSTLIPSVELDRSNRAELETEAARARTAGDERRLSELRAITDAIIGDDVFVLEFDARDKQAHVVIALGDPDTADRIAVTVPGMGSTTERSVGGMVNEAGLLRNEAHRQLALIDGDDAPKVAAIAWIGYQTPGNPFLGFDRRDPHSWMPFVRSGLQVMSRHRARRGAPRLAAFLTRIKRRTPDTQLVLLGHSYGSLCSSYALQRLRGRPALDGRPIVDRAAFYGSPGLAIRDVEQLGLAPGSVYYLSAPNDPVSNRIANWAPWRGWGARPSKVGMTRLSTEAGVDRTGVQRVRVEGHADYGRSEDNGAKRNVVRMSGYNIAAVVAGIEANEILIGPRSYR
ncbi:hypothetical protein nbrc107696_13710 [Gordonia spumicola]|uniref:DUF1023 domain-containing protein n=1 Tax=Gordonia spumicola TaxID=589161 RepID=A0A7I9V6B4_9ACTN|nr:alpha/beta hydrolase [Gordonia spumicola]GEE00925.1 hypothetical protein nbrc107696_13710 [Gordonia spumicola]